MKKVLLLFLLITALLMVPNMGFAQTPFTDIEGHLATADIEAIYEKSIMIGTASDKFSPDEYVNRAQLAVCLVKTFGLNYDDLRFIKKPMPSDLYDDVQNNQWYSDASMITGYNNIFNITERKFKPGEAVTRIELASAIVDSFTAKKLSVITTKMWPNYSDLANLPQKQQSDICFVFNAHIMKYTGNEFKPNDKVTRAELAAILNQTLKTIAVAEPYNETP